ncbi:efflux RND transporter permease subunit [Zavarzinella formosa]|uniref:efflux RND transporter permease subunit n=1 Tax=Zavarzinella formosa TaxID=360055 RepID=UPI0002D31761|nr:efflux RND transporter permease subunit [Zavarzinella formosa]
MLTALIRLSLHHRFPIMMLALVAIGYGTYLSTTMPIDVFPDLDRPRVVLLTECPGLSPEEVEATVSVPIETAMLGAQGVQAVRSQASQGLVVTFVEFGWETEVRYARQIVQERLTAIAGTLPPNIRPLMTPPSSIMGQIMMVGISWDPADPPKSDPAARRRELRTIADWVIRPRLLKEQGIAEVIVMGGDVKQYQILVNPEKLQEYGVTLQEVDLAIRENNLNASGGFTEEGPVERSVRVIARLGPEPAKVLADLRMIPVKNDGRRNVLLGQVAAVEEGPAPKRGDAGIDGEAGVIITVVKQPHADTRAVTDRVVAAMHDAKASLPKSLVVTTDLFQLKSFIDRGIYYVGEALVIGAILVVFILFLFLMNFRTTLITLTAIPLSLVVTVIVFRLIGMITGQELSVNVMTLGGIAVAMGELVDDAIVDVENIFRRLRENNALDQPKPALTVIFEASREVRSAIVFGTAVVILAFMPLFALSGVEGRLFIPLGLAYIVSILASLLVSLTVTPVLSSFLLPNSRAAHGEHDGLLLRGLKAVAGRLIRFSMNWPGLLLIFTWVAVGVAAWKFESLGKDFLPKFDEGSIQVNMTLPAGSSLRGSTDAAALVDAKLRRFQKTPENPKGDILHFVRRTGRAERDEHAEPVGRSEYILSMNPLSGRPRDEMLAVLLKELREEVPGVDFEAEQPLAHLISHMISGVTAQIAVKVYGDDLEQLRQLATRISRSMANVPGVTPPVVDPQEIVDELHIVLRPEDLAQYGLSRSYVAAFVETAMKGEVISQVLEGQRRFDLVVKLQAAERTDYRRLRELRIDLPGNRGQIRLADVADLPEGAGGPNQINRENVRRRAVIRCNVSQGDLAGVVAEIERRVKTEVPMPEGYFVEYGGQFEAQRSASARLLILALVSLAGIFAVLWLLCPSVPITLQILNAIPTAFIGGVLALVLTRQTLTVAALVGFVSLGGIAVRNGILLVTHYLHLMKEEGAAFGKETVLRGSLERLAPVLMTALTAGIGLVPIVVSGNKPGLEILYPVATVILGGLVTSTFCEFLIHPGLFWRFGGRDAERLVRSN